MIGSREGPEVSLKFLQEFHLENVFFGRDEVAERYFEIFGAQGCRFRKQLVARPGCQHQQYHEAGDA